MSGTLTCSVMLKAPDGYSRRSIIAFIMQPPFKSVSSTPYCAFNFGAKGLVISFLYWRPQPDGEEG